MLVLTSGMDFDSFHVKLSILVVSCRAAYL